MNFSTDRDLLVMEPRVFDEVPVVAQQRLSVTDAAVSGTTLTSASANFVAAQVEPGSVVLISDVAHEVLTRVDAGTLTVSLPRNRLADPAIPGPAAAQGAGLTLIARTFAPQAALVHDSLLHLLGIGAQAHDPPITEDDIVSLSVMARLEALATLERIYASAASLADEDGQTLRDKAQRYRDRFHRAIRRATILIDTDGDGHADRRWHLADLHLTRA